MPACLDWSQTHPAKCLVDWAGCRHSLRFASAFMARTPAWKMLCVARTNGLAYGWQGLPRWPVLLWTVRLREGMVKALRHGDNSVFRGFLPTSPGTIEERADQGDGPARE